MTIGIITLVSIFIIGIGVILVKDREFFNGTIFGMLVTCVLLVGILFICADIAEPIPTAMDVYQGKTTLEITYKDSVPIDSTVVFKD